MYFRLLMKHFDRICGDTKKLKILFPLCGKAFDMKGQTGEVANVLNDWKGRVISPTLPVIVAFGRYKAHFRADELKPAG